MPDIDVDSSPVRRSGRCGFDASRAFGINDSTGFGLDTGVDNAWWTYIDVGDVEISDKSVWRSNARGLGDLERRETARM